MFRTVGKSRLSIRGVDFDGSSPFITQQRGSNNFTLRYDIQNPVLNNSGEEVWTTVSHHEVVFNGQFKDDELKEAICYIKILAVKIIQENMEDLSQVTDTAIEIINAGG